MLGYAAVVLDDPLPRTWRAVAAAAVGATFLIAAYHAFLFVGETDPAVTSAAAAVIVGLSPVLTAGFTRLLVPSERLTTVGLAGLCLGLAGAVVLASPNPNDLLAGGVVAKLLVFAAAASFALGSVVTRWLDADLPIESLEAWSMVGGALVLHGVALARGESIAGIEWTVEAVAALAYLSLASSAFGFLIYYDLLDRLGPVEINMVSYVAPLFAALSGWLVLREAVTPATVTGFVLVFAGFILLKRRAVREELPRLRAAGVDVARTARAWLPW
jgi:drug/metabolite transporter (DMT)-like permease